jgi:hypothetical protein
MDVILMADDVSLACDISYLALLGMELMSQSLSHFCSCSRSSWSFLASSVGLISLCEAQSSANSFRKSRV